MAASDYRLCDVCAGKAFYDANLNYEYTRDTSHSVRNAGSLMSGTRLDYLGDWVVVCEDCIETHEIVLRRKETDNAREADDATR